MTLDQAEEFILYTQEFKKFIEDIDNAFDSLRSFYGDDDEEVRACIAAYAKEKDIALKVFKASLLNSVKKIRP